MRVEVVKNFKRWYLLLAPLWSIIFSRFTRRIEEQKTMIKNVSIQDTSDVADVNWPSLMNTMMEDADRDEDIYSAGQYWKSHAEDMKKFVNDFGISSFRHSNEKCIKAFATGNDFLPTKSSNPTFWKLHATLIKTPVVAKVIRKYDQQIHAGWKSARSQAYYKLRAMHALIAQISPSLLDLQDPCIGSPLTYEIEGVVFSEAYMEKLLDVARLEQNVDFRKIKTIIEVGGSYGLLASIILTRYPDIRYIYIDIAPVAAFGEYYLKKAFPGQVNGYLFTREHRDINVKVNKRRISILCSHQLKFCKGTFDLLINTASFQEMDVNQVKMYCEFAKEHCNSVYLNNTQKAKLTGLTEDHYETELSPMKITKRWNNLLHPSYRPLLLTKDE